MPFVVATLTCLPSTLSVSHLNLCNKMSSSDFRSRFQTGFRKFTRKSYQDSVTSTFSAVCCLVWLAIQRHPSHPSMQLCNWKDTRERDTHGYQQDNRKHLLRMLFIPQHRPTTCNDTDNQEHLRLLALTTFGNGMASFTDVTTCLLTKTA